MALLGQQSEGGDSDPEMRIGLGEGVRASPIQGTCAVQLSVGPGKPTARLIPLGLPCHDRPTECGSIAVEADSVVIRQVASARRNWLPVLLTWDKPPTSWRPLTIASRSKEVNPDQAVAFRVAWGVRDPSLVLYRSLGPATLRSFLGHQTNARFLIGTFTRSGEVATILKVEA
jgi:hypothetical protein